MQIFHFYNFLLLIKSHSLSNVTKIYIYIYCGEISIVKEFSWQEKILDEGETHCWIASDYNYAYANLDIFCTKNAWKQNWILYFTIKTCFCKMHLNRFCRITRSSVQTHCCDQSSLRGPWWPLRQTLLPAV